MGNSTREITYDRKTAPRVWNMSDRSRPGGQLFVYCGRPSKWGNPFRMGQCYNGRLLDRNGAIEQHVDWLLYSDDGLKLLGQIEELTGKDLGCWCYPEPCHCDLLLHMANHPKVREFAKVVRDRTDVLRMTVVLFEWTTGFKGVGGHQ